jgi:hypothetical protein
VPSGELGSCFTRAQYSVCEAQPGRPLSEPSIVGHEEVHCFRMERSEYARIALVVRAGIRWEDFPHIERNWELGQRRVLLEGGEVLCSLSGLARLFQILASGWMYEDMVTVLRSEAKEAADSRLSLLEVAVVWLCRDHDVGVDKERHVGLHVPPPLESEHCTNRARDESARRVAAS